MHVREAGAGKGIFIRAFATLAALALTAALLTVAPADAQTALAGIGTACPPGEVPEDGFTDVAEANPHEAAVDCAAWHGIANGTSSTTYGPGAAISRGQMASFVSRLLLQAGVALPSSPADHFADDDRSVHEAAVNQLAELGLVRGSTSTAYQPGTVVRREQMATFLVAAYRHASDVTLPAPPDAFGDDDGSVHEQNINLAAAAGFARGTSLTTFDPATPVRRDQMASFLLRVLDRFVAEGRAPLLAFPTAEGYGRTAVGGRGGRVLQVTNLDDSGPGSLRAALEASGPRIVVFRVAGTITLLSAIEIRNPYVTVAGQSAPGEGITVRTDPTSDKSAIQVHSHDVVIRHLRIRLGAGAPTGSADALRIAEGARRVIVDHVSLSWGVDTCLQTGADARDITIQWSIIAECLHDATHEDGPHSMGYHMRSAESLRITFHHNLLAHNDFRNPQVSNGGFDDLVNNVIYDYGRQAIHGSEKYMEGTGEPMRVNLVGNYIIPGPSSGDDYAIDFDTRLDPSPGMALYVRGNIGPHRPSDSQPDADVAHPDTRRWMVDSPAFDPPPVTTTTAAEAYEAVLGRAGTRVPAQDAVDARIVQSVRDRTGSVIDDPSQVGGWPALASGTPYPDADRDGIADIWETAHGLDPVDGSDGSTVAPSGYTWVEAFLNELAGD